jgi:hypothetical protein
VLLDVDLHVQVARAAVDARLAFAGQPDAHAVVDPGRIFTSSVLPCLCGSAAAVLAGVGDEAAGAVALVAGLLDREEALLQRTWPEPPQVGQVLGWVPGLAPLPWQGSHFHGRNADLGFRAVGSLFQRDFQVVAQVGAAVDVGTTTAATAAAAEDFAEDVAEGVGETAATAAPPMPACGSTPAWPYWS